MGEQCQSSSEQMPDRVLKENGGTLNPDKTDFPCLTGVFNIHTQSKTVNCAHHPPRRLHHFSEHIEYTTPFQNNNNNNNNKVEVQNPDCWVVCV